MTMLMKCKMPIFYLIARAESRFSGYDFMFQASI